MSEPEYSQGICGDGAAILKDGQPMTIEEIVAELRGRAQPSAEPVAWMQSEHSYDPERHGMQRRLSWKKLESDDAPLYAHPPTDSAALRDAAIAELVRRKMTSGNSVPVERCIITAAEIMEGCLHCLGDGMDPDQSWLLPCPYCDGTGGELLGRDDDGYGDDEHYDDDGDAAHSAGGCVQKLSGHGAPATKSQPHKSDER